MDKEIAQWVHPMKDRSEDPSYHERTLLPRSYISLHICIGALFYRAREHHTPASDVSECLSNTKVYLQGTAAVRKSTSFLAS